MLNATLKSSIGRLWDNFWSGGISNPLTAIEQISYLLFMKRLDELDTKKKHDSEFTGEAYESIFEGEKELLRWSHFRQMEGGEMLLHIQTKVFPFLKTLDSEESHFAKHMENAVFIISKPSLLVEAVNIIDEIFEEISKQNQKAKASRIRKETFTNTCFQKLPAPASSANSGPLATSSSSFANWSILSSATPFVIRPVELADFLLGAYQHIITAHTSKKYQKTDENGLTRGTSWR